MCAFMCVCVCVCVCVRVCACVRVRAWVNFKGLHCPNITDSCHVPRRYLGVCTCITKTVCRDLSRIELEICTLICILPTAR